MVTLTDKAAGKVKELMNGDAQQGLRVAIRGGGCSGFQYALAFDQQRDEDQVFEYSDIRLLIDRESLPVRGWLRGRLRRGPAGRRLRREQPERGRRLRLRPIRLERPN